MTTLIHLSGGLRLTIQLPTSVSYTLLVWRSLQCVPQVKLFQSLVIQYFNRFCSHTCRALHLRIVQSAHPDHSVHTRLHFISTNIRLVSPYFFIPQALAPRIAVIHLWCFISQQYRLVSSYLFVPQALVPHIAVINLWCFISQHYRLVSSYFLIPQALVPHIAVIHVWCIISLTFGLFCHTSPYHKRSVHTVH